MSSSERRRETRYDLSVAAVVIPADTPNSSYPAILTQISVRGFRIQTQKDILPGTRVAVFIKLTAEIQLKGKVIWITDEYDAGKFFYRIGCDSRECGRGNLSDAELKKEFETFCQLLGKQES